MRSVASHAPVALGVTLEDIQASVANPLTGWRKRSETNNVENLADKSAVRNREHPLTTIRTCYRGKERLHASGEGLTTLGSERIAGVLSFPIGIQLAFGFAKAAFEKNFVDQDPVYSNP